jgi:hypothetical protein
MFWSKKKKTGQTKSASKKGADASCIVGTNSKGLSREEIRAQALANARAARERVGEETIQKIAAALVQKQMSLTEQAKAQIAKSNTDRVADEIRFLLDDKSETRH